MKEKIKGRKKGGGGGGGGEKGIQTALSAIRALGWQHEDLGLKPWVWFFLWWWNRVLSI